jgi:hypothetical protein
VKRVVIYGCVAGFVLGGLFSSAGDDGDLSHVSASYSIVRVW